MKRVLLVAVSPVFFLFLFLVFLLTTEFGLVLVKKGVNRFAGEYISIGRVEGRLLGGFSLHLLRFFDKTNGVEVSLESLDCSWSPEYLLKKEVKVKSLVATGVEITLIDSTSQIVPPLVEDSLKLPSTWLPFAVSIERLDLDSLKIVDSKGANLFVTGNVSTSLVSDIDGLTVTQFQLHGPDLDLGFHGNLEVEKNWQLAIVGRLKGAGFGFHQLAAGFSLRGPVEKPHLQVDIESPASITVTADLKNLLQRPAWKARLEGKDVDLSTLIEDCPKIDLAKVSADFSGDIDTYRGTVEAEGAWEDMEGMALAANLSGDTEGIDFQSLRINHQESVVDVRGGKISWKNIFSWQGQLQVTDLDAAFITRELQGRLTADLITRGDVKENGLDASFDILQLDGVLHKHKVAAKGLVFLTESDVSTAGLALSSDEVGGVAHIEKGRFSWGKEPSWLVQLRLSKFDPSWLYPKLSGSINGEFRGAGRKGANGLEGALSVKSISGTLLGHELSGGGELRIAGGVFTAKNLMIKSGNSELVVHGHTGEKLDLEFSLRSPEISTFLPEASGALHARGSLSGKGQEPQLTVRVEGEKLNYLGNSIEQLKAGFQGPLKSTGLVSGTIAAKKMSVSGVSIDEATLNLEGGLANHQLSLLSNGDFGHLELNIHGTFGQNWQGNLSRLKLEISDYGIWQQQKTASVVVGKGSVQLDDLCLAEKEAAVCLGGEFLAETKKSNGLSWNLRGDLASLPLQLLNQLHVVEMPMSGIVGANISVNGDSRRVTAGKVRIDLSAADLQVSGKDSEIVQLLFDDSFLTAELNDGLLHTVADVRARNGSRIQLRADVQGVGAFSGPFSTLPIHGELLVDDFKLITLSPFTGYGVELSGKVNNSLTLAGTLGQPKLFGNLFINGGGIELPYQGITLENIAVSIEAGEKAAEVNATVTSGPGQLKAIGTLQYGKNGIEGELHISGNDFLLVNLPEYTFRVNPDVLLVFSQDDGKITGTIDVPYGLIAPEELTDSISVSEDVILVNGGKEERKKGLPMSMDLKVLLGDEVRVDGYGLTGRLGGKLRILSSLDNSLTGRGNLELIGGTFSVYGRTLNIERGRILFTGGPLDNPGLDVRAQMKIGEGDIKGEEYTVGMDISGLVQDLQYQLFSDPYMEDTEILSYLIVGHSFDTSTPSEGNMLESAALLLGVKGGSKLTQGLGGFLQLDDLHLEGSGSKENMSLVVGKRLTKDLYIGYDLNMFNRQGEFRVRYDLTRGFSVETRSSVEATGADLLYSFER